ncbi:cytochrome C biogenesis protein [Bacillus sp. FJAT-42376]|uniref:cytochrome c biogenesis protein ResB n=1 Tax=Bacillus sp. FJAT-42376 TaxID=2014076 RepID=UPI000F4E9058|nr:cytochrome c biogenesis protein ResB [Bacillus sp. FJAT-42376]AZB43382.1 cytochrome C biogenesis protein [Bacillus sp. FJAT-42376]
MEELKCECGHINPPGTLLCESCGKQLADYKNPVTDSGPLLDMRYDGSARRSQTYTKTWIDKVWNFFSSVKVGIWLIVLTLLASAVGTIFTQVEYIPSNVLPEDYYKDEFGVAGEIYYTLGFHNLYGSWWYIILIASLGISLVIASLDRVIPLYRTLKVQGVTKNTAFLKRQRLFGERVQDKESDLEAVIEKLKKKRYRIRIENGNLLAEKGRFSRWGPYVNHVGLIIVLLGAMLRFVPGMYVDENMWLREGQVAAIPGTDGKYFLKNEKFTVETYKSGKEKAVFQEAISEAGEGNVAKNFQTDVILYEKSGQSLPGEKPQLKKVRQDAIRVNQPLQFDSFGLYQSSYSTGALKELKFSLLNKKTNETFGPVAISLDEPKESYDFGKGYKVELLSYLPDFYLNEDGKPDTKSRAPNNPAFVFNMISPGTPDGEVSFVGIQMNLEPNGENKMAMKFAGVETVSQSLLTVKKDLTIWVIALGGLIFMVGVCQGMYWNHRRIWFKRENGMVYVAGHTNKNWYTLKKEIDDAVEGTAFPAPWDQKTSEIRSGGVGVGGN